MRPRLFKKFFFSTAFLIIIVLTFIFSLINYFVNNYLIKQKKQELYNTCHSISTVLCGSTVINSNSEILDAMFAVSNTDDTNLILVNNEGKVLACGCSDWYASHSCVHSKDNIDIKIVKKTYVNDYYEIGYFGNRFNESSMTYGIVIKNAMGGNNTIIYASSKMSSINSFLTDLFKFYLISTAIPLVLLFIVQYFITYNSMRPLYDISEAIESMVNGDFTKRIKTKSKDEIGELANSFNLMAEALERTEYTRRSFVANVSHELRTPMTSIGGFIDGILDGTIKQEDQKKYLKIISNEIKRLSRVTESMFNMAKLEAGQQHLNLQYFDISKMIIEIFISKEALVSAKNLSVNGLEKFKKTEVYADYDLMYQVIYNLCDNAVKFNEDNGYIALSLTKTENEVEFSIRNGGVIIKKNDIPYVFERFYKGDKSRSYKKESTGLGLYIAKTILDFHGGKITPNASTDTYTQFDVFLPLKPKVKNEEDIIL